MSNVLRFLELWHQPRKPKIKCEYCDRYVCERGMAQHVKDKHDAAHKHARERDQ